MKKEISEQVQNWILEEDLPPASTLKPINKFDGLYPEEEEEYQAYWDFIRWALTKDHAVLLYIPKPKNENDFWQLDLDEAGHDVSAFNTVDFQRMYPNTFNKYAYKLKKIYEKIYDLALLHSCVSGEDQKRNIHRKFRALVQSEFRDNALMLLENFKKYPLLTKKEEIHKRIAELNRQIRRCNQIWQLHAWKD